MTRYLVGRILIFIPSLLVIALLVFLMLELVPGDPVTYILGREASREAIEAVRSRLGLDRPMHERLFLWFSRALRGDLGESIFLNQKVTEALMERYPVTLSTVVLSLALAVGMGVPAGTLAAVRQGRLIDWVTMTATQIFISLPIFWLGLNLIILFVVKLKWFPIGGYVSIRHDPFEWLRHLVLPCLSLGAGNAAWIARMTRASVLEVLHMDFVRTARAKGLKGRTVLIRHTLRNAFVPVITTIGMAAGGLIAGSVIIESMFLLPGLGRLVIDAVKRRDYQVIQGAVLVVTFVQLTLVLVIDLLYAWIDPRIRYDQ